MTQTAAPAAPPAGAPATTPCPAPISGFGTTTDGQSIDVVDTSKMAELAAALKTDTMGAYVEKYPQG